MQTVKVNGVIYNWSSYRTNTFKEITGFDENDIEVLVINSADYDFHVVIRIDTMQYVTLPEYAHESGWLERTPDWPDHYYISYRFLGSVLVLGRRLSKKYSVLKAGIRLFINRPRVCKLYDHEIENKHVAKVIQFFDSERFKPYITDSRGTTIIRKASGSELSELPYALDGICHNSS